MLSARTIRNIEAAVVLVGALAASLFVPSELLVPMAAVGLVGSIAGVFTVRALLQQPRQSRSRRAFLLEVGMMLAMTGLAAFIVLLVELTD
jgi:hypothetical protein